MTTKDNPLHELSEAMVAAVEKAGAATLLVDARKRFPASGIAISPDLVLTADHVVERDEDIHVILPDGAQLSARLAGRDPGSDLAALRLERPVASPAEIAAAGGAPSGSSSWRWDVLQRRASRQAWAWSAPSADPCAPLTAACWSATCAPTPPPTLASPAVRWWIPPGASLGLNTSGLGRGAAITIPAALAWEIASTLAQHGHVRRGFIGVRSQPAPITPAQQKALGRQQASGLLLVGVEDHSPAEKGGLLVGDIIVALGGKPVADPDELLAALVGDVVGKPTAFEILRGGQPVTLSVTVGERKS